jgi:hypothetical protein
LVDTDKTSKLLKRLEVAFAIFNRGLRDLFSSGRKSAENTVFFLQNTGCNVFTSQIILNSMNGKSNEIISLRKLNPQCEGDGKRRVSQETTDLPKNDLLVSSAFLF